MNPSQRIAIFIPSLRGGGVERVMTVLSAGMAERGYSVDLVLAKAVGPLLENVDPRVRVVDLGHQGVLSSLPQLVKYLRKNEPAGLLTGMANANLVAIVARSIARSNCRLIVGTHNYLSVASRVSSLFLDRISPLLARWLYPRADHATAVSSQVAHDLMVAAELPQEFVSTIPNPVDIESVVALAGQPIVHPFFNGDSSPVLVAVGRLVREKGFDILLHALPHVLKRMDVRLVILGEGPVRGDLELLTRELHVQDLVSLPGFVSNPFTFMAAAKALVVPSRREGFGNVLVEAMACGTPVVATTCPGGPSEILMEGKFGPLAPVEDPAALAEAILLALQRPISGEILRNRANDYAVDCIVDRYLGVILGDRG